MNQLKSFTDSTAPNAPILQQSFMANLSSEIVKKKDVLPEVYAEVVVEKKLAAVQVQATPGDGLAPVAAVTHTLEVGEWKIDGFGYGNGCPCDKTRTRTVTCTSSEGKVVDAQAFCAKDCQNGNCE